MCIRDSLTRHENNLAIRVSNGSLQLPGTAAYVDMKESDLGEAPTPPPFNVLVMDEASKKLRIPQAILSKWGSNPKYSEDLQKCLDKACEKLAYPEPIQSTATSEPTTPQKRSGDPLAPQSTKKAKLEDYPLEEVQGPFLLEIKLTNLKGELHLKVLMGNKRGPQQVPGNTAANH
eukprot:11779928-Alexandrium_andersonii.AAC.1